MRPARQDREYRSCAAEDDADGMARDGRGQAMTLASLGRRLTRLERVVGAVALCRCGRGADVRDYDGPDSEQYAAADTRPARLCDRCGRPLDRATRPRRNVARVSRPEQGRPYFQSLTSSRHFPARPETSIKEGQHRKSLRSTL